MISHQRKFIFIHIPKCAGTSIEAYLTQWTKAPHYATTPRMPLLTGFNAAQLINLYPNYFIFTFVRNPFARFVSIYQNGLRRAKDPVCQANGFPHTHPTMYEYAELVAELVTANPPAHSKLDIYRKNRIFSDFLRHHSRLQVRYLLDQNPTHYWGFRRINDAPCSFIGRVENFAKDWKQLLEILEIPYYPIDKQNQSGNTLHYSSYYDKSTRRIVEQIYAADLETLGYEFEDRNKKQVLKPLYNEQIASYHMTPTIRWHQWIRIYKRRLEMRQDTRKIDGERVFLLDLFTFAIGKLHGIKKCLFLIKRLMNLPQNSNRHRS